MDKGDAFPKLISYSHKREKKVWSNCGIGVEWTPTSAASWKLEGLVLKTKKKNNLLRIKSLFKKNNLIKSNYYSYTLQSE